MEPQRDDDEFEGGFVRLRERAQAGDVFLLIGLATIAAVGLVVGDYLRCVRRRERMGPGTCGVCTGAVSPWTRSGGAVFGANPPRCSRVWNGGGLRWRFLKSPPTRWQTAPLPELPAEEPPIAHVPGALRASSRSRRSYALLGRPSLAKHPSETS